MILKNDVRVGNLVSIGGSDFFSRIDTIDRYTACVTRDGYTFVSVNWNENATQLCFSTFFYKSKQIFF